MIEKVLCDNLLLVVPCSIKDKIINEISSLDTFFAYKIIDDTQLKKSIFFDYDIKAISYLASFLNINYSIAKEYIEAMYFIEDKEYQSNKLNNLLKYKKELLNNNLLVIDFNFINNIKSFNVVVYGFNYINKELSIMLNKLGVNYKIVNDDRDYTFNNTAYHFEYLEDEVDALSHQIVSLLHSGVDIKKIKIANVNSDYYFTLSRIFKMYNLPINLPSTSCLYELICVKEFFDNFVKNNDFIECLSVFNKKYPNENNTYNLLLSICNKLVGDSNLVNSLYYLLTTTKVPSDSYDNAIELIDINNYKSDDDEYIFVLSVNQGILPKTYKNEDFLSDEEKEELNISTSFDKNVQSKEMFIKMLSSHKNLVLSYKDKSSFAAFNKSFVLQELNVLDICYKKDVNISYSSLQDRLLLASKLDSLYLKNTNKDIEVAYNYYNIPYKAFDHKFKAFDNNKIKDYFTATKKNLSYSALDNYFKCSYRYYLNNVLSFGKMPKNISIDIGNVFHKVLELSFSNDFDFEESYSEQLSKIEDVITKFYLDKHKLALKEIININKENFSNSHLDKVLTEQKVAINYSYPIDITFKGFIDKIIYTTKDDKTYVAIIDYKTGNPEIDVSKVKYGLSMQLPIYLYLLKHAKELKNVVVCGFYLQKLIPKQATSGSDYIDTLKDGIKLQGYSNEDVSVLSMLDPNFASSNMIKSMRVKKDGTFYPYTKVLSSSEMEEIADLVEDKVLDALQQICDCNFKINPKILDGKNVGCKYCEFSDCCFVNHNDYEYLDNKDLEEEGE